MPYTIEFEFDCEGDPPKVYIANPDGGLCIEVLEDPTSLRGKQVEIERGIWEWQGEFSWDAIDWVPGPLATKVCDRLNDRGPLTGAVRRIAVAVEPLEVGDGRIHGQSIEDAEGIKEVFHAFMDSGPTSKLCGILMDTGDVTARRFHKLYFAGNGSHSVLAEQVLLDRVRHGLSELSGIQQGGPQDPEAERATFEGIVQDVAVALLGEEVTFKGRAVPWDLPVKCVVMPYEDYCEMRGEEPDPELLGTVIQVRDEEARLVGDPPEKARGTRS